VNFLELSERIFTQHEILPFYTPAELFWENVLFCSFYTFLYFEAKGAQNG
jgi:hypothetical protein